MAIPVQLDNEIAEVRAGMETFEGFGLEDVSDGTPIISIIMIAAPA